LDIEKIPADDRNSNINITNILDHFIFYSLFLEQLQAKMCHEDPPTVTTAVYSRQSSYKRPNSENDIKVCKLSLTIQTGS
jgi:hypothetical protein